MFLSTVKVAMTTLLVAIVLLAGTGVVASQGSTPDAQENKLPTSTSDAQEKKSQASTPGPQTNAAVPSEGVPDTDKVRSCSDEIDDDRIQLARLKNGQMLNIEGRPRRAPRVGKGDREMIIHFDNYKTLEGEEKHSRGAPAVEDSLSVQEILTQFQRSRQQPATGPSMKQNWNVRMECLVKLMRIGPTAVPVLIDCLKDEKAPPYTRAFAAQALGLLADARARPTLVKAMEDKDRVVQLHAIKAVGRLGRLEAEPRYRKIAEEGNFQMTFALTRDDEPDMATVRRTLAQYDLSQIDAAQVGRAAPDFSLCDTTGKTHRLGEYRGQKVVVLVFLRQIW